MWRGGRSGYFTARPRLQSSPRTCKAFVERLKQAGADVQLAEHPNAHHGFDNPLAANPPTPIKADQSVRDCTIRENENAVLINEATKAPFTYKDECVRIGPTVGADPEALQAATTAVTEFVRSVVAR
jgi:dienelactone hydrolase